MGIYDYHTDKWLPKLEEQIKNAEYLEVNRYHILDFENSLFAEGLKSIGILRYITCLNIVARTTTKDFKEMDKTDVQRILAVIERSNKAPATKSHYKTALKRFFRWLQGEVNAATWINTSMKRNEMKLPENLLTEAEVKRLIEAANHPRDKALIAVLYDSGCRIGELGSLQIKNVSFDQFGAILNVHGKTGSRIVRLPFSAAYISAWLDIHPLKDQKDAFVFVNIKGDCHRSMRHDAFLKILTKIGEKAELDKPIHPHLFRHSRATVLANHLTEAQMNAHLGWVQGSGMPGVYVHLSGRDTEDAILKMYGKSKTEETLPELTSRTCPRCKKENGPTSSFCAQCGLPLDMQALQNSQKREEFMMMLVEKIMSDPQYQNIWNNINTEEKKDDQSKN